MSCRIRDPLAQSAPDLLKPALSPAPDGGTYWLGTDDKGRDILSRLIYGSRLVLFWSGFATIIAYAVGMMMGVAAGYRGGWWDEILSFIGNVFLAFPQMVLYIVILSQFGPESPLGQWLSATGVSTTWVKGLTIVLAVMFATAPQVARIVRGIVLDLKTRDYVAAAEVRGESPLYIMLVELLPNARGPLIVDSCLQARLCDHRHRRLGLPRPRPAAARSRLGQDDLRGARLRLDGGQCHGLAGDCHFLAGARPQSAGRRPARNLAEGLSMTRHPVLECKDVSISYYTRAGEVPAVYDFNLTVNPGEAVGIVGESGCGKSTVALAIMQYMGKNGAITGGEIRFMGRDMRTMSEEELRSIRGSQIAMVYQEPMASLNPSMLMRDQLIEVPMIHEGIDRARRPRSARSNFSKRCACPIRSAS